MAKANLVKTTVLRKVFGCCTPSVYRFIERGMPHTWVNGHCIMYDLKKVLAWANKNNIYIDDPNPMDN